MAINFPSNPSVDDTHTENGYTFQWDGTVWNPIVSASSISTTTETVKTLAAGTSVEIAAANMAAGASANVEHGLGQIPDYIEFFYECVTANNSWEVGNRIPVKEASRSTVGASDTHVYISLPSGGAQIIVADRDGGDQKIITLSEWKAVAIPYIFENKTFLTGIS